MNSDILDFQVGLQIAARSGTRSWYGRIVAVTKLTVRVAFPEGGPGGKSEATFMRASRFLVGSEESRYTRPYICSVARARDADVEYAAATKRAAARLAAAGVL